jgi:hypothetical protein
MSARLAGAMRCFELSARGVKLFAAKTDALAGLVGGEDGALRVAADEVSLDTEETE